MSRADLGEGVDAKTRGHRALVEDIAPDQHLDRLDAGGRGELGHDASPFVTCSTTSER